MSPFGVKVREVLDQLGKDNSWLHHRTGIAHSTISHWMHDPDVQPSPLSVAKVAKATDRPIAEFAEAAGYEIRASVDGDARAQRRYAIVNARPRLGTVIDRLPALPADKEDLILSMLEAFLAALPPDPGQDQVPR